MDQPDGPALEMERLFDEARHPHVRDLHAEGSAPCWHPPDEPVEAAAQLARSEPSARRWLLNALSDSQRKWFVAHVVGTLGVPDEFFEPMIYTAVVEPNPSFNRHFVDPCVVARGTAAVRAALRGFVVSGSDREAAGAAQALYWSDKAGRLGSSHPPFLSEAERVEEQRTLLTVFLQRDSLEARRSLLPELHLPKPPLDPSLEALVDRVVALARSLDDEYIERRLAVQLGKSSLFPARRPLSDNDA
jgi:hypothetical protein